MLDIFCKIGCQNCFVEIDESKFVHRGYNKGHPVVGQWVFGGIKKESGKAFLVSVEQRNA